MSLRPVLTDRGSNGFTKLLRDLKPHKASRPGNISTFILMVAADDSVSSYLKDIHRSKRVPIDNNKKVNIVALFKESDLTLTYPCN